MYDWSDFNKGGVFACNIFGFNVECVELGENFAILKFYLKIEDFLFYVIYGI